MDAEALFWKLAAQLHLDDKRVVEGTIMGGRCLRVGKEFLALVDYKGSGLVVKLSRERVSELIASGVGRPFAPAGRVFAEWVAVPDVDARAWRSLLKEGIEFVSGGELAVAKRPSRRRAARTRTKTKRKRKRKSG